MYRLLRNKSSRFYRQDGGFVDVFVRQRNHKRNHPDVRQKWSMKTASRFFNASTQKFLEICGAGFFTFGGVLRVGVLNYVETSNGNRRQYYCPTLILILKHLLMGRDVYRWFSKFCGNFNWDSTVVLLFLRSFLYSKIR